MSPPTNKIKLLLLLSAIIIISFAMSGIINYQVSRDGIIRELSTSSLPLTRDTIYSEILTTLMEPINVSSTMANDAFLKEWCEGGEKDTGQIIRYLKEIKNKYGYFTAFFVSAKTGRYYHYTGVLKTMSPSVPHDVWYYDFINSGDEYDLDVDTNEAAKNVLTIFINCRISDSAGNLLGVTGVGLKMDAVATLITQTQNRYHRRIFLTDTNGVIQAHGNTSLVEHADIRHMPGINTVAEKVLNKSGTGTGMAYESEHGEIMLVSRYLPELNWFLVVEQDQDAALAYARGNLVRTLVVGVAVSLAVIILITATVNRYQSRLEHLASRDELTGLLNRRAFEDTFLRAVSRRSRNGEPFSFILLDLDNFKEVNDHLGHLEGDRVLKKGSAILLNCIRPTDTAARWGGDEFLILAECPATEAGEIADRILTEFRTAKLGKTEHGYVSASCGVSEYQTGESLDQTLARADQNLFAAKDSGRNTVQVES